MAPPHAFFALPLLLLGAASIQRVNTANSCAWAVDSCERSAEDSPCKVRLRRWCPCQKRASWKCECKERKKCGDESLMVNVSEARKLTKTKLKYASKLETFCDLKTCSTFSRKCVNFQYYDKLYEDYYLEKCCYDHHLQDEFGAICKQAIKYKWCFLTLCGYHPKPKLEPKDSLQTWTSWAENDDKGFYDLKPVEDDKNDILDRFIEFSWLIFPLVVGTPILSLMCYVLYCYRPPNQPRRSSADSPESQRGMSTRKPVYQPLCRPQPGEPVPLNRLPATLKEKLPDPPACPPSPPCVNINEPE